MQAIAGKTRSYSWALMRLNSRTQRGDSAVRDADKRRSTFAAVRFACKQAPTGVNEVCTRMRIYWSIFRTSRIKLAKTSGYQISPPVSSGLCSTLKHQERAKMEQ